MRMNPYPPIFSSTPARTMLTAVGASVWASGNQVWTGQTGSLMAKATRKNQKASAVGMAMSRCPAPASESSTMLKVPPGATNMATMLTSMKALPRMVNTRNFMAEYSLRPVPHMEMSRYMGSNSSSQNRKNSKKSREVNTPMTAVCSTSSHAKYSRIRCSTRHEASTAHRPMRAVNNTSGALRPSTPR